MDEDQQRGGEGGGEGGGVNREQCGGLDREQRGGEGGVEGGGVDGGVGACLPA